MKYCSGDNPAILKGNLEFLLPKQPTMHQNHHKALAVRDLPHFWRSLIQLEGISSLALQFLILTAARTIEVIKAQWNEFDLDQALWMIPKERMKTGRLHRYNTIEGELSETALLEREYALWQKSKYCLATTSAFLLLE